MVSSLSPVGVANLSAVANQEKLLPPDFISADGFGITEAARRYLAPLIEAEAYPPSKDGLPDYVKLKNVITPRKLTTAFAETILSVAPARRR